MAAADERWKGATVTDRTSKGVELQEAYLPPDRPKFEIRFTDENTNGCIAAQTARCVLQDEGYDVYYATRNGRANRDPEAIIVVVTEEAEPIA